MTRSCEALLGHAVGHQSRADAFRFGTPEQVDQGVVDSCDMGEGRLTIVSGLLVVDIDDAAGIDDVVGRVEDVAIDE